MINLRPLWRKNRHLLLGLSSLFFPGSCYVYDKYQCKLIAEKVRRIAEPNGEGVLGVNDQPNKIIVVSSGEEHENIYKYNRFMETVQPNLTLAGIDYEYIQINKRKGENTAEQEDPVKLMVKEWLEDIVEMEERKNEATEVWNGRLGRIFSPIFGKNKKYIHVIKNTQNSKTSHKNITKKNLEDGILSLGKETETSIVEGISESENMYRTELHSIYSNSSIKIGSVSYTYPSSIWPRILQIFNMRKVYKDGADISAAIITGSYRATHNEDDRVKIMEIVPVSPVT